MESKEFWSGLPPDLTKELQQHSRKMEFKRGENIYRQGDKPQGVYIVEQGLVGLMLVGAQSGKEHLLRFFRKGQFFGHRSLFSDEPYHGSTIVLEPTQILFVPKSNLIAILDKYPKLYLQIVQVIAHELRRAEVQHVMILENQILSRVALSLIYLKDLHPDHNWTRQEIANFCASTVSTIIKALAELEEMGLISQAGRAIQILNRDSLIELQDA